MTAVQPRHVLCVLGNWSDFDRVEAVIGNVAPDFTFDSEYSCLTPDDRMENSFNVGFDRVAPTMTEKDWDAVRSHSAVAYVLSPPLEQESVLAVSGTALKVMAELLKNGGVAAKSESAGLAHGRDRWLGLAEEYRSGETVNDCAAILYSAWVRRPLEDTSDGVLYSCGLHLLGERDVEIDATLEVMDAVEWIDCLGLYLVADKPHPPVIEGAGFRPPIGKRVMNLVDCCRYEEDSFLYNPYGYIRLNEAVSVN